jgi:predicted nucleotidyltransferase
MPGEVDVKIILAEMVGRIVARFQPEKIILFGSYARGEATCDSDLDLLIIMNLQGSRRQMANEIDLLLADRLVPLDLLILTPEELERQRGLVGTIGYDAVREGVVIYDRAA